MPGTITFGGGAGGVPLGRSSAVIGVFRYAPAPMGSPGVYQLLPNVRCLSVQFREGADPGVARFRYAFGDPNGDPSDPQHFEQVYPLDATGPRVVHTDDQIVVRGFHDDGSSELLFHGFVQIPQADLNRETETVSFEAMGCPVREWDVPLAGAILRDANDIVAISDILTDLPARFNPDGKPNATPTGVDSGTAPTQYPVFLGPVWPKNQINGFTIDPWTLGKSARYVIRVGNPAQLFVTYTDIDAIDALLRAMRPVGGDNKGPIDAGDPSTFTLEDIETQDIDVTGEAWPEALVRLIAPHGFKFRFVMTEAAPLGSAPWGDPQWGFAIWRDDSPVPAKPVFLQAPYNDLDPGLTNTGAITLQRDMHGLFNRVDVDAAPIRVEASFILAPGFLPDAADAATAFETTSPWILANQPTGADKDKYRLWVFDECGEGHYDEATDAMVDTPGDFKNVLTLGAKTRPYAIRRRPGIATCISVDEKGKPERAALLVSFDYAGDMPGVWDGTGDWMSVDSSEWRLLDDRLGFYLTPENPNNWFVGQTASPPVPIPDGKLNLIEWLTNPTVDKPFPRFMLVCCVDSDQDFNVVAPTRPSSPTQYQVGRRADARDRFRKTIISKWSVLADPGLAGFNDEVITDDTAEAQAFADGVRRAEESGSFAGSITIPRLNTVYSVGDKIVGVLGRNVSFRSNIGANVGESPIYPAVAAINWQFDGHQSTTLELTDRRAEPAPKRTRSTEHG